MTGQYIPPPPLRIGRGRAAIFFVVLVGLFLALVLAATWRLNYFMPKLQKAVSGTYLFERTLPGHRGDIVDIGGRPLAMNADVYHATADLQVLRKTHRTAEQRRRLAARVSEILQTAFKAGDGEKVSTENILAKFSLTKDFVFLRKNIPPFVADKLSALQVRAIRNQYKSGRFYPGGEIALPVVGYIDHRGVGMVGVEYTRQRQLSPSPGRSRGMRTSGGEQLLQTSFQAAKNGARSQLMIDSRLQFLVFESLQKALHRHGATAAAAAVMDVQTGGLVAIANAPSFNPNKILPGEAGMRNYVIADEVEPGSTAKPFVVALALEENKTTEEEILPTAAPLYISGKLTVKDNHIRDNLSVGGVIQKSSNIGAVLLARRVGKESLWNFYRQLGFGGGRVLKMPGESGGVLRHFADWRREDFATHAYGYGFSVSLLQLLRAYSVFAGDGKLLRPRLLRADPFFARRVLSAKTAARMRRLMQKVTAPGGTATAAAIDGYLVGGKTGTAKKFIGGKYDDKNFRAFFVGFAPATNPRYLAAVMVDSPQKNGRTGGAVAAPIFRQIMRRALLLNGVPPDDVSGAKIAAADDDV